MAVRHGAFKLITFIVHAWFVFLCDDQCYWLLMSGIKPLEDKKMVKQLGTKVMSFFVIVHLVCYGHYIVYLIAFMFQCSETL